jgi:hypothetical protein
MCVCFNSYKNVKSDQERNQSFSLKRVTMSSAGCVTCIQSIRNYPVDARHGANIISILTNFVALVRERTIPTERPPLVGEVNANFYG